MKIIVIAITAFIVSTSVVAETSKTALLPEVKQIIESVQVDEAMLDKNVYAAMMGMNAPAQMDYKEIGKKVIINNTQYIQKALKDRADLSKVAMDYAENHYDVKDAININSLINNERYQFPCRNLFNYHCVADVIKTPQTIEQLTKQNALLVERYQQIQQLPLYNSGLMTITSPLPNYQSMMFSSDILLATAILKVEQAEIEQGLTILQKEVDFYKRILNSDRVNLIDVMIATRQLLTSYHVISELLDSPKLAKQLTNPKLSTLLKPLTAKEQQAVGAALASERSGIVIFFYSFVKQMPVFFYDANATANVAYQQSVAIIANARLVLPASAEYYQNQLTVNEEPYKQSSTAELVKKYGMSNYMGGALLEISYPIHNTYLNRLYDLSNYLTLVNTKLQIKQAGIAKDKVTDYLVQQKAVNPYTNKPIIWSAETQVLSTDWLQTRPNDADGKQAAISIEF